MSSNPIPSGFNRRQFINTAALATAGAALVGRSAFGQTAAPASTAPRTPNAIAASNYAKALVEAYGRPNSRFNGVLVGTITYSFRSMPSTAEDLLKYCVIAGISGVEMMGAPADGYLNPAPAGGRGGRGGLPGASPAQTDAYTAMTAALAPLATAAQTARTNLTTASLRTPGDAAALRAAAEEINKAELALANARAEQIAKIQGSANKLNEEQLAAVYAANGGPAPAAGRGGRGAGGAPATPAPMPAWMTAENLVKLADLRRMYNEAGVTIYGLKNVNANQSDAELDYRFEMAKVLGATHVTVELGNAAATERLGAFALKHKVMVGYHTHAQGNLTAFDVALGQSPYNAINVDTGHYMAATGESAIPLLRKYPDRVASIHLKDRQKPENGGGNLMWGQGDTDIVEICRAVRDEKWNFPVSAELEYSVPQNSNAVIEIARCRAYCASALMT